MSPPRLHVAEHLASGQLVPLEGDRAHYLRTVLRLRDGAEVRLFNAAPANGRGAWPWSRVLVESGWSACPSPEPGPTLAFAPIRRNRLDWLIEKAVELGVARLVPVLTERGVVRPDNALRLAAMAVEAAEQCERLTVPPSTAARQLAEWLGLRDGAAPLLFAEEARRCLAPGRGLAPLARGRAADVGPEGASPSASGRCCRRRRSPPRQPGRGGSCARDGRTLRSRQLATRAGPTLTGSHVASPRRDATTRCNAATGGRLSGLWCGGSEPSDRSALPQPDRQDRAGFLSLRGGRRCREQAQPADPAPARPPPVSLIRPEADLSCGCMMAGVSGWRSSASARRCRSCTSTVHRQPVAG